MVRSWDRQMQNFRLFLRKGWNLARRLKKHSSGLLHHLHDFKAMPPSFSLTTCWQCVVVSNRAGWKSTAADLYEQIQGLLPFLMGQIGTGRAGCWPHKRSVLRLLRLRPQDLARLYAGRVNCKIGVLGGADQLHQVKDRIQTECLLPRFVAFLAGCCNVLKALRIWLNVSCRHQRPQNMHRLLPLLWFTSTCRCQSNASHGNGGYRDKHLGTSKGGRKPCQKIVNICLTIGLKLLWLIC